MVQFVHNLFRTETEIQSTVETEPYVKTSCISNQKKAEFVGDIFIYEVFGEVMAKFC